MQRFRVRRASWSVLLGLVASGCATANGFQLALKAQLEGHGQKPTIGVLSKSLSNAEFAREHSDVEQQTLDETGRSGVTPAVALVHHGEARVSLGNPGDLQTGSEAELMAPMSLTGDQACFVFERPHDNNASGLSLEEYLQDDFAIARKSDYWLEVFDSLAELPERPLVNKERAIRLEPVRFDVGLRTREHAKYFVNYDGRVTNYTQTETSVFTLCGPAPKLSPSTRYVTVSKTRFGWPDRLFIWEITDEPSPTVPFR